MRTALLSLALLVVSACNPPPDVSTLSTSCTVVDDCTYVTPVETRCEYRCFCGPPRRVVNVDAAEAYREEVGPQLPCAPEICFEQALCSLSWPYCFEGTCGVAQREEDIPVGASSWLDE